MSTFTLDTSGFVWLQHGQLANTYWEDLDPFTRGYIEALFAWFSDGNRWTKADFANPSRMEEALLDGTEVPGDLAFSDLAPEALALILKDCGEVARFLGGRRGDGASFWVARQQGRQVSFSPLAPYLREDGKVDLR